MALISKLTAIAEAIRSKTNTTEKMTLDEMPSAIEGIQSGGDSENLLDYTVCFSNTFEGVCFDKENVTISFGKKTNTLSVSNIFNSTFNNASGIKKVKVETEAEFSTPISLMRMFRCSTADAIANDVLEEIDLTGIDHAVINNISNFVSGRKNLKRILGELDLSSVTSITEMVSTCSSLEDISFKASTIFVSVSFFGAPLLNDASIQSIIDGLADLTGSTAQTLTIQSSVFERLSEEQKAQVTSKNWTLAKR